MKHIDKKLSDDFSQFLNQKLFYRDGKEIKQTKNKLELFNRCTTLFEEFINTYMDENENPVNNIPLKPIEHINKNVISIKTVNPIAAPHGCTIMTASESMKADEQRGKK